MWVGSDDGVVSVTQDAGKTWTNVTSKISGVPKWTYVSDVLPSRAAAGTAYVAFDGHRGGDYNTYVFATTDYGATWRSIAGNLPKGEVARGLAEDRRNADILYLGTETGLCVSWNRGAQWTRIKANLPTMPIYEIKQHPRDNDLILSSHARGIWILDDLSPIQQWAKSEGADAFMFDIGGRDDHERRQRSDEGLRGRSAVPRPEPRARRDAGLSPEGRRQGREADDQGRGRHDRA